MSRPKQKRHVCIEPEAVYFKPRGIPLSKLEELCLKIEELEALRLSDIENLSQAEAAVSMGISRHTFGRVLASARQTVAKALIDGKALRIEGGHFIFNSAEKVK